jgi:esterase/lipase superfamily enzyme
MTCASHLWFWWSVIAVVFGPTVAHTQSRAEIHRGVMAEFNEVLKQQGPDAALTLAQKATELTLRMAETDPRRTDAMEMLVLARLRIKPDAEVLKTAEDLVQRRQRETPVEAESVAGALFLRGTMQFALNQGIAGDRSLADAMTMWRQAYRGDDVQLAEKLSQHAEIQRMYNRPRTAIALLQEALALWAKQPQSAKPKRAELHQRIGLLATSIDEFGQADKNVAEAERLMADAIAARPADEELKAGLVQMLVSHAGLEIDRGPVNGSAALIARGRSITFKNQGLAAESRLLLTFAEIKSLEAKGDVDGALKKSFELLEFISRQPALTDLIPDLTLRIGWLYLQNNDADGARTALMAVQNDSGGEANARSDLLFALAELARLEGKPLEQKRLYQRALNDRKTQASEISVFYATNRAPLASKVAETYGGDKAAALSFGTATVLVPGGQFSQEASLAPYQKINVPVGAATDAHLLAITSKTGILSDRFDDLVKPSAASGKIYKGSVLVFVHGYNNTFDDSLKRTAQLVRDLNFDGTAFAFGWPSQGNAMYYGTDRKSAADTVDALASFLVRIAQATGTAKINIIAHSMGNRVLLPALVKAQGELLPRIGEVILASPCVDLPTFNAVLDKLTSAGFDRLTMYASSHDTALWLGYLREFKTPLAGFITDGQPVVHAGLQTIDVSEAGNIGVVSDLNHDIFATNPVVTEDMRQLLQQGVRPPNQRISNFVTRTTAKGTTFWSYLKPD